MRRASRLFMEWWRFILWGDSGVGRILRYSGGIVAVLVSLGIADIFQQPGTAILSSPWVTYVFDRLNVGWVIILFVLGLWLWFGVGVAWERSKKLSLKVAQELEVDRALGMYRWHIETDAGIAKSLVVSVTKVIFWNGELCFPAASRMPLNLQWTHNPLLDILAVREAGALVDVMRIVVQEGEPPYLLLMGAHHQQEIERGVAVDGKREICCLLSVNSPNCRSIKKWISFSPLGDVPPYYKATIESPSPTFLRSIFR